MEQLKRELVKVTQMEANSAGSKDVGGEVAAVDHCAAAAAAVPDSAVDASILRVKQVEVEFVNAATVPMDSDP